ncbi:MAG TPA: Uma2 family endonuclease [Gemmataceae bacterium]|jgi:Uma2 family endonuclease|nr:Uma2 family endonuclease [Gemmataceae bacterium]
MSTGTITPATYRDAASLAKFSVARYQRMIESGAISPEDKVELLENYLVLKMPRNPPHDGTIDLMDEALRPFVPNGWRLRVQLSLVLSDSQPEPDFALVRGMARTFVTRHPTAADAGLVVEVADSSLLRDQRDKTRIYARASIPVYWIINLVDRRIEVYSQPSGPTEIPAYGAFQTYQPGDAVPLVLDGVTVATVPASDLLP